MARNYDAGGSPIPAKGEFIILDLTEEDINEFFNLLNDDGSDWTEDLKSVNLVSNWAYTYVHVYFDLMVETDLDLSCSPEAFKIVNKMARVFAKGVAEMQEKRNSIIKG